MKILWSQYTHTVIHILCTVIHTVLYIQYKTCTKYCSYSVIDYVLLYRQCLQYVGENNMEPVYTNTVKIQIMYCFTYCTVYGTCRSCTMYRNYNQNMYTLYNVQLQTVLCAVDICTFAGRKKDSVRKNK